MPRYIGRGVSDNFPFLQDSKSVPYFEKTHFRTLWCWDLERRDWTIDACSLGYFYFLGFLVTCLAVILGECFCFAKYYCPVCQAGSAYSVEVSTIG